MEFSLQYTAKTSKARAGTILTNHGAIQTPIFMPVGTGATVKAVHQRELQNDINAQIILGNAYHLYLRPGTDLLVKAGGLHKFMNWERPILTDSGGYQIFSLTQNRKLKEEGAHFASHIDGSKHLFTPEKVIEIQRQIGSDIMMSFDECPPYPATYEYVKKSMELTHRWLKRCVDAFHQTIPLYGHPQSLFPIVQGGMFSDLREQSAVYAVSQNMDGYAIGGLSVGEPADTMYEMTEWVCRFLPEDKPRYLMGVGTPENILECIALGIDMFDCVMPTRNGRNGMLFTPYGIINIKNKKWESDFSPIDAQSDVWVDTAYSKGYLRHLFISNERLASQIASIHNLHFYMWLVREARKQIIAGNFSAWKDQMVKRVMARL
ncbi:MAG: tRNA guanosine(34) transglycosylase Tgt [Flavobacteriales bacterium]|nr:tRNA guanosine(34) transglycosylase Tgt [Flavobacteriales bacterium]MCZ2442615.1 tRNA guanosine(34) transglycosylase Tgt [Flavobacteriales bacterium]